MENDSDSMMESGASRLQENTESQENIPDDPNNKFPIAGIGAYQPISIATTERDITERKQTGRLVFESRASRAHTHWYDSLLDGSHHPSLFQEAYLILVSVAGYCLAWIDWAANQKTEPIPSDSAYSLWRADTRKYDS